MSATIGRMACGAGLLVCLWGCRGIPAPRGGMGMPRRDPVAAQRFNDQGLALLEQGQLADATAALRQATVADPFWGPAQNNLGVALLRAGQYFDAAWTLQNAAALMPKAAAPRANLGLLYESVGRYGPSEESLQAALKLAPDDVEIIGYLARLRVRQGRYSPDTVAWLQTVSTQDDDPAWRNWAREKLICRRSQGFQEGDGP
jgi:Flp pilus assembly protein TadD